MRPVFNSLALVTVAAACATTNELPQLKVTNLKQGLARVESQNKGTIYSEGTIFRIAQNGQCVAVGEVVPCMWFAIAFDYEAAAEVTTLTCTTSFDKPVAMVDPSKDHGKDRTFSGPVTLKGRTGKAFWPGYVTTDAHAEPSRSTTVCSLEGKEVLKVQFAFE